MDLNELLKAEGFDSPELIITNTGETFEYFKHVPGVYEGFIGRLNTVYKNLDGEKCEPTAPGASAAYGMLDIFIDTSPDGHGFFKKVNPSYGESVYKQYVTFESDRQWQNKQLFLTFNLPQVRVVQNPDSSDFKINLKNLAFFVGRSVTFELAMSTKGNIFLKNLFLTDKTPLEENRFLEALSRVKEWYAKLDEIKQKEQVKKDKDDKALENFGKTDESAKVISSAGLNPEDYE